MTIHLTRKDHTLFAEIDRPDALNAVDTAVMEGLERAIDMLRTDKTLRVFVLRGQGSRAFISGGDLKEFHTLASRDQIAAMSARMHAVLTAFETLDVWTIACVNGAAYGGGIETLLAMDLTIASEEARFGFTQARFHIPPGWGGLTRLVHRVGRSQALHWLGTAAIIDAAEAHQKGLVHILAPKNELNPVVWHQAQQLSMRGRDLIGALKTGAHRAHQIPRDEAIAAEIEPFVALWMKENHLNEVEQFLTHRGST